MLHQQRESHPLPNRQCPPICYRDILYGRSNTHLDFYVGGYCRKLRALVHIRPKIYILADRTIWRVRYCFDNRRSRPCSLAPFSTCPSECVFARAVILYFDRPRLLNLVSTNPKSRSLDNPLRAIRLAKLMVGSQCLKCFAFSSIHRSQITSISPHDTPSPHPSRRSQPHRSSPSRSLTVIRKTCRLVLKPLFPNR